MKNAVVGVNRGWEMGWFHQKTIAQPFPPNPGAKLCVNSNNCAGQLLSRVKR